MTLTVDLTPDVEARLRAQAQAHGKPLEKYLRVALERLALPQTASNATTLALLDAWDAEDATDDPKELQRRQAEWEELQRNLNANRAAANERPLFA